MRQAGYAQLILIGVVAVGLAGAIWFVYDKGYDAGYQKRIVEEQEIQAKQEETETQASENLEKDRETVRTIYRTITKEVERVVEKPVYRDVCLDPDGLRVANAALAGALVTAGEPDSPMPNAQPSGER